MQNGIDLDKPIKPMNQATKPTTNQSMSQPAEISTLKPDLRIGCHGLPSSGIPLQCYHFTNLANHWVNMMSLSADFGRCTNTIFCPGPSIQMSMRLQVLAHNSLNITKVLKKSTLLAYSTCGWLARKRQIYHKLPHTSVLCQLLLRLFPQFACYISIISHAVCMLHHCSTVCVVLSPWNAISKRTIQCCCSPLGHRFRLASPKYEVPYIRKTEKRHQYRSHWPW